MPKHYCTPPDSDIQDAPEVWCCPECKLMWERREELLEYGNGNTFQESWYQPTEDE